MAKPQKQVKINSEWCKGCSICVDFCPKKVLVFKNKNRPSWEHPDRCVNCGLCELRCPDLAIELV